MNKQKLLELLEEHRVAEHELAVHCREHTRLTMEALRACGGTATTSPNPENGIYCIQYELVKDKMGNESWSYCSSRTPLHTEVADQILQRDKENRRLCGVITKIQQEILDTIPLGLSDPHDAIDIIKQVVFIMQTE